MNKAEKQKLLDNYKKGVLPKDFTDPNSLTKTEAKQEINILSEAIKYHDVLYYNQDRPVISDQAYDGLYRRLSALENNFPDLKKPNSPTLKVGGEVSSGFKKISHQAPMLSLDSAPEEEAILSFLDFIERNVGEKKVRYFLEPKYDGFSIEVVYKNGELVYAATRGDGLVGEDVTTNAKTIKNIPLTLSGKNHPKLLSVRGEVYMPKNHFIKLNKKRVEEGLQTFSNPRNAAAGIMRQLDSRKVADKALDIFFYEALFIEGGQVKDHEQTLVNFKEWGLKTSEKKLFTSDFKAMKKFYDSLLVDREKLQYEMDGLVLKVDNYSLRQKLGYREKSPRYAYAWKFPARQGITTIQDITVGVGRTGTLTPVALLLPVDIGGVTVSRASLHNEDFIKEKDLRIGDMVRVKRAGDVIPEVVLRIKTDKKRSPTFKMPTHCPVCKTPAVKEGAYLFCPNGLSCQAQMKAGIEHFAERKALNIEGLGEKVASLLVEKGLVSSLADLYKLKIEDFKKLDGFADLSSKNLYEAIQNKKEVSFDRFLYGLGIHHVGQRVAKILALNFADLEALEKADRDDLLQIKEIGPEIADSVIAFFKAKKNLAVLSEMKKLGVKPKKIINKNKQNLKGLSFVFTGELENFSREEAKQLVESFGARAASSVSLKTDFVIAGPEAGSKLKKAKEFNVKILNENEFMIFLKNKGISLKK